MVEMYPQVIEVRRKYCLILAGEHRGWIFTTEYNNIFSDSSLKSVLLHAMLFSEMGFAHVRIKRSQYLKWQHDDKHRGEWEIKYLFSQSFLIWCLLLMPLWLKVLYFWCRTSGWSLRSGRFKNQSDVVWYSNFTNGIQCKLVEGFSMHWRIWQLSKELFLLYSKTGFLASSC